MFKVSEINQVHVYQLESLLECIHNVIAVARRVLANQWMGSNDWNSTDRFAFENRGCVSGYTQQGPKVGKVATILQ